MLDAGDRIVAGKYSYSYFYTGGPRKAARRHLRALCNREFGVDRAGGTLDT